MALLSRNVSVNCGGTSAFSASLVGAKKEEVVAVTRGDDVEEEDVMREQVSDVDGTSGFIGQGQGETNPPPPYVQELCWGNGAHLTEALVHFQGFGPDVVLA